MGVPVVTLAGATLPGRHGVSILGAVGLDNWVAHNVDDYVAIAKTLAEDSARLAELRRELRPRCRAAVVCDGPRFARAVEAAYGSMWDRWRAEQG